MLESHKHKFFQVLGLYSVGICSVKALATHLSALDKFSCFGHVSATPEIKSNSKTQPNIALLTRPNPRQTDMEESQGHHPRMVFLPKFAAKNESCDPSW